MKKFLSSVWGKVLVILSAIGVIAGGVKLVFSIDHYYAKSSELKTVQVEMVQTKEETQLDLAALSKRLDQKILIDRLESYRQRYWKVTDRLEHETDPNRIRELKDELRFLENEIKKLERQLEELK
jgi:hypothetical protein